MINTKNIAVIGSGYWGKNLVRNFHSLGALRCICDTNEETLKHFAEKYPTIDTCQALTDVLSNPEIEGVVIATPAETHYTLAREILLSGKHVYIEKPLALNADDGHKLVDLAEQEGLTLMVGHLLHYHPGFVALRELVASGGLGQINYIYSNRLNLGKIRREENALWSFAPHDISMILSLVEEEPSSVLCTGGNYLHKDIADVTTTHMEFESGVKAHIFVSWLHPFKEQKLVVVGEKKMAVFDDTKPWDEKLTLYPHKINWEGSIPVSDKADAEFVELAEAEPLKNECAQFLSSIKTGQQPYTDGHEGLRVLRVLDAAQRSLDQFGAKICGGPSGAQVLAQHYEAHESVIVEESTTIGSGTSIWHFSRVLQDSRIGKNCRIGQNVVIGPNAIIGDGCKIQNNISIYKGVTLEDEVFCGPSMVFTNVLNPRAYIPRMATPQPTLVKRRATLGANCTIVCGTTIGEYALIGAGAVITKDVPAHALMVGNPARPIGWVCACGYRLQEDLTCSECGATYQIENDELMNKE